MAKILTDKKFRERNRGCVFSYGCKWMFGKMLILQEIIQPDFRGNWGFWACDPFWIRQEELQESAFDELERAIRNDESVNIEDAATRYMNYDSGPMDVFFVLEPKDLSAIFKQK